MNRLSRSSRPTGPKMRVARGSPWSVMSTAAFSSNRIGAVFALGLLGRPHDHRLHHLALLDLAGGNRVLDRDHDDVAQAGVATLGPAEHANDERAPRARVVRDLEYRL